MALIRRSDVMHKSSIHGLSKMSKNWCVEDPHVGYKSYCCIPPIFQQPALHANHTLTNWWAKRWHSGHNTFTKIFKKKIDYTKKSLFSILGQTGGYNKHPTYNLLSFYFNELIQANFVVGVFVAHGKDEIVREILEDWMHSPSFFFF